MFFRGLKPKFTSTPTHLAEATLPVRIGRSDAETLFARPLDQKIRALGLGQVTGTGLRRNRQGDVDGIDIFFALTTLHPDALKSIGDLLSAMDAPVGSHIEFLDTGKRHIFGRTEGMGLYLDRRDGVLDEDDALDLVELLTDELGAEGVYQGQDELDHGAALYFYGDSFVFMEGAIADLMERHPQLVHAEVRRLA